MKPRGPFHTQANQILDADGRPVRLAGVSWFGFETETFAPHGLAFRRCEDHLGHMAALGFNTVRLPFCLQMFEPASRPGWIDYSINPELEGLRPVEILDRVIAHAGRLGLWVILDCHRSEAGGSANSNGLWYTDRYPECKWIETWVMLARRYRDEPAVIAADLFNEPHGPAGWGVGGPGADWRLAAERAGNALLAAGVGWLILVEGVESGPSGSTWWGGNLSAAADHPVRLDAADRLVYSAHDYPASVHAQPWFDDRRYPQNLPAVWDRHWGYLVRKNVAPVLVGEMGSRLQTREDRQWLAALVDYLRGGCPLGGPGGGPAVSWVWWSWNPNSADTGGILADDWKKPAAGKIDALRPLLAPLPARTGPPG
jgi:aryl-phospho-beta-D-glucosidase BglC (GH1 family)